MKKKYGIPLSVAEAMLRLYEWRWPSQDTGPVPEDAAQVALNYYGKSDLEKLLDLDPESVKSNRGTRGFGLCDEALSIQRMVIEWLKDNGSPIARSDNVMHFTTQVTDMIIDDLLDVPTANLEIIEEVLVRAHFIAAFRRVENHKKGVANKLAQEVYKRRAEERRAEKLRAEELSLELVRIALAPKPFVEGDWLKFARERREEVKGYGPYTVRYVPAQGFEDRLPPSHKGSATAKGGYTGSVSVDMFESYGASDFAKSGHLLAKDGCHHQKPLWPDGHFDNSF